jgi:hypothetical protein
VTITVVLRRFSRHLAEYSRKRRQYEFTLEPLILESWGMGSEDGEGREGKGKEMFIPRSRPVSLHRRRDRFCSGSEPAGHSGGGPLPTGHLSAPIRSRPATNVPARRRTSEPSAALDLSRRRAENKEKETAFALHDAAREGRPAAPGLTGVAAGSRPVHQWRRPERKVIQTDTNVPSSLPVQPRCLKMKQRTRRNTAGQKCTPSSRTPAVRLRGWPTDLPCSRWPIVSMRVWMTPLSHPTSGGLLACQTARCG